MNLEQQNLASAKELPTILSIPKRDLMNLELFIFIIRLSQSLSIPKRDLMNLEHAYDISLNKQLNLSIPKRDLMNLERSED